ncbi:MULTISPECIES: helix-turn-helix domain-containing protein [unclassified Isoptericola]|uniref:helix-turn-helix domain-containing protein n=1 Tax=unclassified Isoptericola TaxID=2623355 RepID=UPI0036552B94
MNAPQVSEVMKVIDERRKEQGLSVTDIAAAAGLGARSVERYFAGVRDFKASAAVKLAVALGTTASDIYGEAERRSN